MLVASCICDNGTDPPIPPPLATPAVLLVSPAQTATEIGRTATFTVQVIGGDAFDQFVTWTAAPANLASLAATGLSVVATGVSVGTAVITATSGNGVTARANLIVNLPATVLVDRVDVTPPTASFAVGGALTLTATPRDAAGNALAGRSVSWQSADSTIVSVTPLGVSSGTVTGRRVGIVNITATVEGKTGSSTITVTSPPPPPPTNRYAYALADNPTSASYTANAANAFSSAGQPVAITRSGPGRYQVSFPGLQPAAGQTQVVLVNQHAAPPTTCKVGGVSSNATALTVLVDCYTLEELGTDQPFTILVLGSNALPGRFAFGFADQRSPIQAYTPSSTFSSSGQSVQVRSPSNGVYAVEFTGNARPAGGSSETALVVAAGSGGARCTANRFLAGDTQSVHCVGGGANAGFDDDATFMTVLLERGPAGRRFAFAAVDPASIVTDQSYSSSGGAITATRPGIGRTDVVFAGLGRTGTNGTETVHVGANSGDGGFCNLMGWQTVGANLRVSVQCYDSNAQPANIEFRILIMQ